MEPSRDDEWLLAPATPSSSAPGSPLGIAYPSDALLEAPFGRPSDSLRVPIGAPRRSSDPSRAAIGPPGARRAPSQAPHYPKTSSTQPAWSKSRVLWLRGWSPTRCIRPRGLGAAPPRGARTKGRVGTCRFVTGVKREPGRPESRRSGPATKREFLTRSPSRIPALSPGASWAGLSTH